MNEKLSYTDKEELEKEEYSEENDPMVEETNAILSVIEFVSKIWLMFCY